MELAEFYLNSHITKLSPDFRVKGTIHPKTGLFSLGLGFTVLVVAECERIEDADMEFGLNATMTKLLNIR